MTTFTRFFQPIPELCRSVAITLAPIRGTLPRGHYNLGMRLYPNGGGLGYCDIGLSSRFMLGISYGGEKIVSAESPNWNRRIGFSLKFRLVDELEYFPAISVGFTDQGYGAWEKHFRRYIYKSRRFYTVVSRSYYFYKWTSGWHAGVNYSLENDIDEEWHEMLDFFRKTQQNSE